MNPPIMLIFHPGKGMTLREVKDHLKQIDPKDQFLEFSVGVKTEHATLVLPLGVFKGGRRIRDSLAVLKNMMRYIV